MLPKVEVRKKICKHHCETEAVLAKIGHNCFIAYDSM